jgi:hypothetical protein
MHDVLQQYTAFLESSRDYVIGEALRASGLIDAVAEMRSRVFGDAELRLP